ncbi:MAG: c-type cytochrome [Planctomycetota bacterium]|nr:c-type cytochrome [Planctomycetota bacterium]
MPHAFKLGAISVAISLAPLAASGIVHAEEPPSPRWIWSNGEPRPEERAIFGLAIDVPQSAERLTIRVAADNRVVVRRDGEEILRHDAWARPGWFELDDPAPGPTRLEFDCRNADGPAGLAAVVVIEHPDGDLVFPTGPDWQLLDETGVASSSRPHDFGPTAQATDTWSDPFAEGRATPAEDIVVPDGFEIELLHAARPGEGSWSAMTVDSAGRIVLSPQYGPLLRITPATTEGRGARVERLHPTLGRAQGLLFVDDALYVNVADDPARTGGLWRLRDADGDDRFESTERLAVYGSASEHGPHGLALGPDGMIWMVNGNYTSLPPALRDPSPHDGWAEDTVVERLWDPRGHAVGIRAPGGVLLRTDLDGQEWEIVAAGMRNPYDLDFNADGECFTYDADMEWDIGLPWYRTPRFLHLVSGAEYGWRSGSGKWPLDSAESFPAVLEMDAGSPTGVASGHRSNFPAPWRDSMFLGDWAYGRVLAVELEPRGATYAGTVRPFLAGRPFNVTDFDFAPDGSLLLTTGGRGSQSGLYRVRWAGPKAADGTARSTPDGDRRRRRAMEVAHRDPLAVPVDDLLSGLADRDPAVRRAARIGFEHRLRLANRDGEQDEAATLIEAATSMPAADGGWEALLGIMRAGDRLQALEIVERFAEAAAEDDGERGRRALARTTALLVMRHGPLEPEYRDEVLDLLEEIYPTGDFGSDRILVEVLVALDAPFVVERTVPLIAAAEDPEEAIHHLHALRLHDGGWDDASAIAVADAIRRMESESGGASFPGYVQGIRDGLLSSVGGSLAEELAARERDDASAAVGVEARRFVRKWDLASFEPHLSRVHAGRDFARGEAMFTALQCAACHRVGDLGIAYGPDLTGVGARFSPRDLLIATIDPARDLSDQYAGTLVRTAGDEMHLGLPIERTEEFLALAPDPRAGVLRIEVPLRDIETEEAASPMPAGLVDTASMDEVLDLLAYLRAAGNPEDPAFQRPP